MPFPTSLLGVSPPGSSARIRKGLVAYWPLDELSDGSAALVNRADLIAGQTMVDVGKLQAGPGKFGNGLSWPASGAARYLHAASTAALQSGNADFTWVFWFKLASKAASQGLLYKGTSASPEFTVSYMASSPTDRIFVEMCGSASYGGYKTIICNTFGSPAINAWHLCILYHDALNDVAGCSIDGGAPNTVAIATGVYAGSGDVAIGVQPVNANPLLGGFVGPLCKYNRVLSAAERAWLWNSGKGHPPIPTAPYKNLNIIFEGDSNVDGGDVSVYRNTLTWPYLLVNGLGYKLRGWAYEAAGGETVVQMIDQVATQMAGAYRADSTNVAVFLGGTNDLRGSDSAAAIYANIQTWCAAVRALGYSKIVLLTVLPSTNAGNPGDFETRRLALNALLAADHTCADALVDVAALCPNPDDTALYYSDKLHINAAGHARVAPVVRAALQALV